MRYANVVVELNLLSTNSGMNPDLKTLIELQRLDDIIRGLYAEVLSLPQTISRLEAELAGDILAVDTCKKSLDENQKLRRRRESDIAVHRDKISKLKDQSIEVKTNEQYKALLHEIEFHEAEISKIEDQILAEMIDSENLTKRLRETEQILGKERSRIQQDIAQATRRKEEDEIKLHEVRGQRSEIQVKLSLQLYEQYERIARFRKGQAVVIIDDASCGACHVKLRPQVYAEALHNAHILTCASCGRILYYVPIVASEAATV